MRLCFVFPGQGAQYVGMGKDFYSEFSQAKNIFEKADSLLGYTLSEIIFNGPQEELTKTKHSQLAIYVNSCAILEVLKSIFPKSFQPAVCAGLSLGEYTALYASGKVSFEHGLQLVQKRAQFMNDACEKYKGKMSVVLGLTKESIDIAIEEIEGIWVANCNCPGQVVISGTEEGISNATAVLKENGAKRILPLDVHGAFHSGLMEEAKGYLTPYIEKANIVDTDVEFVMNVEGDFVFSLDNVKKNLALQVTHPVLWERGIRKIEESKVDLYVEIGCGKTLSGMNKKIMVLCPTITIEKIEDIEQLKTYLNQQEGITC